MTIYAVSDLSALVSFENLAHYTRGIANTFFLLWAFWAYENRKQNKLMLVFFAAVSFIAFCFLKDTVFIIEPWKESVFVQELVTLIDLVCTPFVCALFYEATCPGIVTIRQFAWAFLAFFVFIPFYALTEYRWIPLVAFSLSAIFSVYTFIRVCILASRYQKCIQDNYSEDENKGVRWVVYSAAVYFVWFFVYFFCFAETTWVGEVLFDLFSIAIWMTLRHLAMKHKIIPEMQHNGTYSENFDNDNNYCIDSNDNSNDCIDNNNDYRGSNDCNDGDADALYPNDSNFELALENKLLKCMTEDKLFLTPQLTLSQLALAVKTNRTYLSQYINGKGESFSDLVNKYRVEEACRLLNDPTLNLSMVDLAAQCGFNSISSFNRYFYKVTGMSPTKYRLKSHEGD